MNSVQGALCVQFVTYSNEVQQNVTLIFKFSVSDDSENVILQERATTKQTARQRSPCKLITEIIFMFQGNTISFPTSHQHKRDEEEL